MLRGSFLDSEFHCRASVYSDHTLSVLRQNTCPQIRTLHVRVLSHPIVWRADTQVSFLRTPLRISLRTSAGRPPFVIFSRVSVSRFLSSSMRS